MKRLRNLLLAAISLCSVSAWGQMTNFNSPPHIGYFYPAGGRQGSKFEVVVGGQYLRGVDAVHITGDGVRAKIVKYYRPFKPDGDERKALQQKFMELRQKFVGEMPQATAAANGARGRFARRLGQGDAATLNIGFKAGKKTDSAKPTTDGSKKQGAEPAAAANAAKRNAGKGQQEKVPGQLPEHPLLRNLDSMNLRQLQHVAHEFMGQRDKQQMNAQISESVVIEFTVDAGAAPGNREVRLGTNNGLSNPMCFQVGQLPETTELEPNEARPAASELFPAPPKDPPANLPVVLNGQIRPGDIDRFRFRARKGQQLVVEVQARSLIPYLADAVPGWFQATLAMYDSKGKEVAYADDYRFNPDPVLFYKIPEDGEYEIEVRDSIYRGREDFVYRIAVSERPFVTQVFPLGGQLGEATETTVAGWNLAPTRVPLDTRGAGDSIRQTVVKSGAAISNGIAYAVDTLPEAVEVEPNDTVQNAQAVNLPLTINGRVNRAGDVDVYRVDGRAGDELVAEVWGRRLNSPIDSLVRVVDSAGKVVEFNDDHEDKGTGLQTHHADSYVRAKLPAAGSYYVQLSDSQKQGGEAYSYRLRMAPPQPDFALRVTPSTINVAAGRTVPICVHALRQDGFAGEIEVALKGAPAGFVLAGGRIPAGTNSIHMTLTAPNTQIAKPVTLQLEGRASIGGQTISHAAVPAEDMMQAFLPRHLVPSQALMASIADQRMRTPALQVANGPVRIPAGGTTQVQLRAAGRFMGANLQNLQLELSDPPEGVTLQEVKRSGNGFELVIKAEKKAAKAGRADNLIVEAFGSFASQAKQNGKAAKQERRSLGVLPAIPCEIVVK